MLSLRTIAPDTLELLKRISSQPLFRANRLVGGTALALQYGHRKSVDLDFFGTQSLESEDIRNVLAEIGNIRVIKESKNINIYDVDGVKVDFVNYKYEWIDSPIIENGIFLVLPLFPLVG